MSRVTVATFRRLSERWIDPPMNVEQHIDSFRPFIEKWARRYGQYYAEHDWEPTCYDALYKAAYSYDGSCTFVGWLRLNLRRETHSAIRTLTRRRARLHQIPWEELWSESRRHRNPPLVRSALSR